MRARIWMFSVMGGLKSLAAVVLIKIKIVLVVAAIVAVVVFTIKYLLAGITGLPDLGGLLYKGYNNVVVPQYHPPVQSYQPVVHEPVYEHGRFANLSPFQLRYINDGVVWPKFVQTQHAMRIYLIFVIGERELLDYIGCGRGIPD